MNNDLRDDYWTLRNSSLDTVMAEIAREVAKHKDEIIFDAFEKCGYSREWIYDGKNFNRIHVYGNEADRSKTIWSVDGVPLFELIEKIKWDSLIMKPEITVRFLAGKE